MVQKETIQEHMRRLGCFSPGEVEALVKAGATHEKIDQLAENKAQAAAEAEPEAEGAEAEAEAEPVKQMPEVIPSGMFWCTQCPGLHQLESKIGQRHLKYQAEA